MFLDLNDKVELVANDVGQTPMCWNSDVFQISTMKSLGSDKQENKVSKTNSTENCDRIATVEEKIDFSNVKIEPLFEETVDFDTLSKSDFRAVKVKDCVAVPKSKKLLQFTLDDGTGTDRTILSGIHAYYEPEEVNRIKNLLRDYTDRVTKGETSFATLARLYSEDPGSARQGGELGYMGRGVLDPAFAAAAFNLTDPKKVSKVVESEFGYHIIQLIDRRGDKVNVRHILLKPNVSIASIDAAKERLDSIGKDIQKGKFTFEDATAYLSDDKDTKNNHGLMVNSQENTRTSRFKMKDLPTEVARVVDTMKVGEISVPFQMTNARGKVVCAIVKLKERIPEHRATITEDFQAMRDIVTAKRRKEILHDWVVKKVKETYVRINPRYKSCNFQYEGWLK